MIDLPDLGERVIVNGMYNFVTTVLDIQFMPKQNRHIITLDWGEHGKSYVYDTDEGKTWYRLSKMN